MGYRETKARQCQTIERTFKLTMNTARRKLEVPRELKLSSEIPPSSNPRTFRKYNQSCIARHVLLPQGFTEYIYHVGNEKQSRSIVKHGLIPGGVSLRTGRQAVFFTVVNPMDNQDGSGETRCDLSQARIAP